MQAYTFKTDCISSNGPDISAMVDRARQVTYETLTKHVSPRQIQEVIDGYAWGNEKGLHMKNDYCVSFHKSIFQNRPCYYIRWSAIEYVFTA